MFNNIFRGKKVLITGNTGFKGSWLTFWLLKLGAKIVGISKDIPTSPSLFKILELENKIFHNQFNIIEKEKLQKLILNEKPDFIFHLAAQAIVSKSYFDSFETIQSNVLGTCSLLESMKSINWNVNCVMITSDKSYLNKEWVWGYKETDTLGGKDIYSGSKASAEQLIYSYYNSFFKDNQNIKLAVGRAGNVIGGGDWAKDRIVVDTINSWSINQKVLIRSPYSTRPWQHVLEPLSGYLNLALHLSENNFDGEAYNFGPSSNQDNTVLDLIKALSEGWFNNPDDYIEIQQKNKSFKEAHLLKLNCDKALNNLKWKSTLDYKKTCEFVSSWYFEYYKGENDIINFTDNQINEYQEIAKNKNLEWAQN